MAGSLGRPELAQRLGFDLANALARYVEFLTDLLQRMFALAADAEAQPDHLLLFGGKRLEDVGGFIPYVGVDHGIHRRPNPAVLDQVAQRRFAVTPHWCFERNGIAGDGLQLLDLLHWNVHAPADLVIG